MIPNYPDFGRLELSDRQHFNTALRSYERGICELSFATQYIWQDFDRPLLTRINGNLCIFINPRNEEPFFLEPIGRNKIATTLKTCLEYAKKISRASSQYSHAIHRGCYELEAIRDHFDYIYETKALSEMKGRTFDGKRNHVKKFRKTFPTADIKPLSAGSSKPAIDLFLKWFDFKKSTAKPSEATSDLALEGELAALDRAFEAYDELKLKGFGIFSQGHLLGFVIGSELNRQMACIHFMYGQPDAPGIYQMLHMATCRNLFANYAYINAEQDLGITGLRRSKLSYRPIRLEEKYEITLKQ